MDAREARMDSEFDQYVIEMKPLVLRLPHKAGNGLVALESTYSMCIQQNLLSEK